MKIILFANTEWYLYNFRRALALALRDAGDEILLLSPPGLYGTKLSEMGLRWESVPMVRRSLNPIRELALLWHLVKLLRHEKPFLVHGFTVKCAVYGSLAARIAGVPARVSAVAGMGHVFISNSAKARLLRPVVRFLIRVALGGERTRLILQNPDDVVLFEKSGMIDPAHIRLIPGSGVDCDYFKPDGSRPSTGPMRVLMPGRLLWEKGLGEFVAAARLLRTEGRDITFLLAGEPDPGNPASAPEATVREWVGEGVVEWLGHVDDMQALYRSVHVVCLPSYREGLPKGLIEGAASGCALVTTDVPGCREVVSDLEDGLRVPVRDFSALADALRSLHLDRELRVRLGHAARLKAMREFDVVSVNVRTIAVYKELGATQ